MDWTFVSALGGLGGAMMGTAALLTTLRSERNRRAEARLAESNKKKSDAEALETLSDASIKLVEPLRARIEELERAYKVQKDEIVELRRQIVDRDTLIVEMQAKQARHEEGIKRLSAQVVSLGGQPVYQLPDS